MDEVQKILKNPLVSQGLKTVAPQVALGVDIVTAMFASQRRKPRVEDILSIIDKRLAEVLKALATTESKHYRQECEIRAHELLGVLNKLEHVL